MVDESWSCESYGPEKFRQQVGLFLSVVVLVFTTNCSPKYHDDDLCDRLSALAVETNELLLQWQERTNATLRSWPDGIGTDLDDPFIDVVNVIRTSASTMKDLITRDDRLRPLFAVAMSLSRTLRNDQPANVAPCQQFIADELEQRCPTPRGPRVGPLEAP